MENRVMFDQPYWYIIHFKYGSNSYSMCTMRFGLRWEDENCSQFSIRIDTHVHVCVYIYIYTYTYTYTYTYIHRHAIHIHTHTDT
jgi:hypothetical protein